VVTSALRLAVTSCTEGMPFPGGGLLLFRRSAYYFHPFLPIHSDSPQSAARELAMWFKPEEIFAWTSTAAAWIYE
jgi:hypothetical protein